MTSSRTDRPKISVILPTYCPHPEVEDKLRKCVKALYGPDLHGVEGYEFIIVEQGIPIFGTADGIELKVPNPDAYLRLEKPCGFACAVNLGVSLSHGEYLFIVNNDIVLPTEWDSQFLHAFTQLSSAMSRPIALLAPIDQTITLAPDTIPITYWDSWWSCVLIPRSAWDVVGPLDEAHLPYRFHDQDWSIRAHQAGYHVLRTQAISVFHDEASTYRHMKDEARDAKERDVMMARHSVTTYAEYLKVNGHLTP